MKRTLREGFTTGTAAAAAAKAAAIFLLERRDREPGEGAALSQTLTRQEAALPAPPMAKICCTVPGAVQQIFGRQVSRVRGGGKEFGEDRSGLSNAVPTPVDVPLPAGGRLVVPVAACWREGRGARATVIKDAGDDPDVTHGAAIQAHVTLDPAGSRGVVTILGGQGVGLVTRPGLPVPPGEPAINPAPRRQITAAVAEALAQTGFIGSASVLIEVPQGEAMARRTLNPRLGITGGISILGTRGTVRPYSHEAWAATISQCLDVAGAAGLREICFATGGRSERLLMALRPELPVVAFIQAADFFGHAMAEAGRKGFTRVTWGVFFGKLIKQAQGIPQTHARHARMDMRALAETCALHAASESICVAVAQANTAMHALEILEPEPALQDILEHLCRQAAQQAQAFSDTGLEARHVLFSLDGKLLAQATAPGSNADACHGGS